LQRIGKYGGIGRRINQKMEQEGERMTDLKPCPFCGGNNIERLDEFSIGCHDCHLVVKLWGWGFGLPREITNGWNRRPDE